MPIGPTQLKSSILNETLRDVLDGKFNVRLNAVDLFETLNELSRIPTERLHLKSLEINRRINGYIRLNSINNIFKYFTQNIDRNKQSLDNNLKTLLLEFCNNFLIACSSLTTTSKNHQEIFDNYFTFLNSLCKIPKIHDVTFEENHDAFGLIALSDGLLKRILTSNSTHTKKSVTYFFSALGHLAFNLGLEHHENEGYISTIDQRVVSFYNAAKASADLAVLGNAVYTYAYILKGNDTEEAQQHCQDLIHQACPAVAAPTVMPITTVAPEVMRTESRVERTTQTTRASYHPKNVTFSSNNSTKAANHTTISSTNLLSAEAMRTEVEIAPTTRATYTQTNATLPFHDRTQNETRIDATLIPSNYPMPSTPELIAAAGHGLGNGVINAASQQLSEYLINRSADNRSRIPAIALNLATLLVHSGYVATLPLILASLQNSDVVDENAKDEMWERIIPQVIPSFFTNLGFGLGFQLLNHYQAHYLSRLPTVKAAVQSIPVVSTAYAAISAPISTAVNIGAATASSLLTKTAFNFFSSASKKKASQLMEAEKNLEMQPLSEKKDEDSNRSLIKVISNNNDLKKFYDLNTFITENNVGKIRIYLTKIINCTETLSEEMNQEIFKNKLKDILKSEKMTGLIYDNDDLLNFISGENEKNYDQLNLKLSPENLKTLLQTIQKSLMDSVSVPDSLLSTLDQLEGGHPGAFVKEIQELIKLIRANVGFIKTIITPALLINVSPGCVKDTDSATLRKDKGGNKNTFTVTTNNRRNTIACYSSTSEESRTSECDPIETQQEQPLLKVSL